jgi:hypothetical protein
MTMSRSRVALTIVLVLLVALVASAAYLDRSDRAAHVEKTKASEKPTTSQRSDFSNDMAKLSEDEIRDVVNVLEFWTLTDKLDLTDSQLVSLIPKYRRLKAMRERFWQSRPDRYRALETQRDQYGPTPTPEQNAQLRAAFDAFQKENDTFWSEHEKVRQAILNELTPRQQIAYLIWESESPRKTGRVLRALRKMGELRQPPKLDPGAPTSKPKGDVKTPPEPR